MRSCITCHIQCCGWQQWFKQYQQKTRISSSWDWISFSILLTQRLTVKLFDLICPDWPWSFSSFTLHFNLFLFFHGPQGKHTNRLLKPGLCILLESGPIKTQVCLPTERACKHQTNFISLEQCVDLWLNVSTILDLLAPTLLKVCNRGQNNWSFLIR